MFAGIRLVFQNLAGNHDRALDIVESKLSYALRFNSISNFLACISSFEIMPFSEISAFLAEKLSKSLKISEISRSVMYRNFKKWNVPKFQEVEYTEISRSGMYRNFKKWNVPKFQEVECTEI